MDLGIQTAQIANRAAIYGLEPKGRNRVNTAYMVCVFCGQLTGTAVGNRLFAIGGWKASGSASLGFVGVGLLVGFARGPREKGWVGWGGGWGIRRKEAEGGKGVELPIEGVVDGLAAEESEARKSLGGEGMVVSSDELSGESHGKIPREKGAQDVDRVFSTGDDEIMSSPMKETNNVKTNIGGSIPNC